MSRGDDFLAGVFVGVLMCIASFFIALIFKGEPEEELVSNKEIKPSIKITCIEVDGSKECDTTYIYKK